MKKRILSILTAAMMCLTLIVPGMTAQAFANPDSEITSEEAIETEAAILEEQAVTEESSEEQETTDKVTPAEQRRLEKRTTAAETGDTEYVPGSYEYIMEYDEVLVDEDSWTKTFTTERPCRLEFFVATDETDYYWCYNFSIRNVATDEIVYSKDGSVDYESYFDDFIQLDPGTYTITFTNVDYTSAHFYLDVGYQGLHTAEDPYYTLKETWLELYTGKTAKLEPAILPEGTLVDPVIWSSENPDIATVDETGLVTAVSAGETAIVANMDGHLCKCYLYIEDPVYKINTTSVTLYAKKTKQLKITVNPSNYGLDGLTWTSSNPTVATVSKTGLVTAKAKGTATITAKVNGVTRTCKVTVKPMQMSKSSMTVYVNKTKQLSVYGGTGTATWKSSNKNVATVTSKGVVKGKKPGTATITAKKNGKTFKCKVTVKWEPETGTVTTTTYKVSYDRDIHINMKGPGKLTITMKNTDSGSYADDLDVDLCNPNFKDVFSRTVAPGKTKTVTVDTSKRGTYYLYCYGYGTVTVKKTTKPTLSKSSMKVGKGYTGSLKVYGVKNGGKWSSSNKKIATVTSKGVVKGKKKGSCYIKYTLKTGKVIKCKVTVVNPVTCSVTYVDDVAIYNDCGVRFTNNTNKKVTYIKFNIKQYDNRGKRLYNGPYDWYYVNDDLPAKSSDIWECWVSDDAKKCKAYITKVYFADGTTWRP